MPQMPNGPGAPSDIGPDGGVLPPDAVGPDGLPIGGEEDLPPGAEEDEGGFPPDAEGDDEGFPPEDDEGPPEDDDGDGDEGPPPPKKKDKGSKKESVKTYRGPDGQIMTEEQFVRHLAAAFSGNNVEVLARLRAEARDRGPYLPVPHPEESGIWVHMLNGHPEMHPEPPYDARAEVAKHDKLHESLPDLHNHVHGPRPDLGTPILPYIEGDQPQALHEHLVSHHGFGGDEPTGYDPEGDPESEGPALWDLHHNEHQVAGEYKRQGLDYPPGVMPRLHVHRSVHGTPLEASKA